MRKKILTIIMVLFTICLIPVNTEAATKKLNKTTVVLTEGQSVKLKVLHNKKKVVWKTTDKTIARVSKKGKVTAVGRGTCRIRAKVGKKVLSCKVKVKSKNRQCLDKDSQSEIVHVHSYEAETIKLCTCTEDGLVRYTCSCGDSYEEITKAGHDYTDYICSECGEVDLVGVLAELTGLDEETLETVTSSSEETSNALKEFYATKPAISTIGSEPNYITDNGSHAIRFQWTETSGAAGYYYEIATDEDFTDIIKTGNMYRSSSYYTNSVTASLSDTEHDLYVRVRAYTGMTIMGTSYKFSGVWSDALLFKIEGVTE